MVDFEYGITLASGCTIIHGAGANIKEPFAEMPNVDIPVVMHELDPGQTRAFRGQLGFIEFDTSYRLPRHVHISPPGDVVDGSSSTVRRFTAERIVVLSGVALVELNGEIYVIPPQSLVTIAAGVPHTWTACPAGVQIRGSRPEEQLTSTGTFLMVYEYEDPTGFFPTKQTMNMTSVDQYVRCDDLESIRIPALSKEEVHERCWFVWDRQIKRDPARTEA